MTRKQWIGAAMVCASLAPAVIGLAIKEPMVLLQILAALAMVALFVRGVYLLVNGGD